MDGVYSGFGGLVGNTPLVELSRFGEAHGLTARILGKLEYFNPAGSIKDRVAWGMIIDAEQKGLLTPQTVIVEPTSGNTGIGLAAVAACKGYRAIFTMPDTMSRERQRLIKAYGAEIVLTPGEKGITGAIEKAAQLAAQLPHAFIPGQFNNPANPAVHYATTGPEIWADTHGRVDIFVAGVGTGGTISGAGKYLKQQNLDLHIIAVEPAESRVLSQSEAGGQPTRPHGIQGIGAGFVPDILDTQIYDEVVAVPTQEAYNLAASLAKTEGLLVGISSGAALYAAAAAARQTRNKGKAIAVVLPDTGERYLSV
jgi:cysteine synthase A